MNNPESLLEETIEDLQQKIKKLEYKAETQEKELENYRKLAELVRNAREHQKGFYSAEIGSMARRYHQTSAMGFESLQDKWLKQYDEPSLFND